MDINQVERLVLKWLRCNFVRQRGALDDRQKQRATTIVSVWYERNPICRTVLQRILAGRASDWPPAAFYCPRFFFGERLPNARRSRARVLLAPRTGQTVRGRVGVGVRVRVRVRVRVGWGLCRYLGQKCAKTSCKNSLQARPANGGSRQ